MFDSFRIKVDSGQVDGQRLCITGRSAGGYTTLASLAFRDTFKAGASLYGVSFKFLESYYCVCHKYVPHIRIYSILAGKFTIYPLNPFVQVSDIVYCTYIDINMFFSLTCFWSYSSMHSLILILLYRWN